MKKNTTKQPKRARKARKQPGGELTFGIDLGDRSFHYCVLGANGDVVQSNGAPTTKKGINAIFAGLPRCRLALEAGTHSPWVSRQLRSLGHEVIVANPRRVRLIAESRSKCDRLDAETLARLARIDPKLLFGIRHRSQSAQADLTTIRARAALVESRTR